MREHLPPPEHTWRALVRSDRRFRAAHDVKAKGSGTKHMRHPLVGDLTLSFETFLLADTSEQALMTHHGEPGSPSAEALRLLASWGADATQTGSTQPGSGTPAPYA
ncbi:hypothetical protein GCM10010234_11690 [Streptomyces hawaiiensis]